jgi:uncharacterized protein (TIGR02285 family)
MLHKTLFCCFCIFSLDLNAKEVINWVYSDFPPAFILKGEYKNHGYAQLTQTLIKKNLPEFTHAKIKANYGRSSLLISKHSNYCHSALLKTKERLKFIEYSNPAYLLLGNKLFVKDKSLFKVKPYIKNNTVDLNALLNTDKFTLAIAKGSIYGDNIDKAIMNNKDKLSIYERTAEDHFIGLSKLLSLDNRQIDGFIGYPAEEFYVAKTGERPQYSSFSIQGETQYQLGYIGCSKTNFGKHVINKVNGVLKNYKTPVINNFYKQWLPKEQVINYEALLADYDNGKTP